MRSIQAEVVDWLAADAPACGADSSGDVDLLLAADLLIYLGDLKPLFVAARRRLRRERCWPFRWSGATGRTTSCSRRGATRTRSTYIRRLAAEHDWSVVS